jgi:hypothetical protein
MAPFAHTDLCGAASFRNLRANQREANMLQPSNRALWALMALLSGGIAILSYRYLAGVGPLAPNVLQNTFRNPWLGLHVAGSATALLVGPLQFNGRIRRLGPQVHRWLGRTYAAACLLGAAGGFVLAWGSTAGPVATAGFGTLAVLWTLTTVQAWRLAVQRRFAAHRAWMIRSFALTFAAVTLRIGLGLLPVLRIDFMDGFRALSILSWVVNLAVVEIVLARRARRTEAALQSA